MVFAAALCLLTGLALWHWVGARNLPAARLVPAETLLLADFPDLPTTALRWKKTALSAILAEPEVQEFLAQPRARLQAHQAWGGAMESLVRIRPRRGFFAVANIVNNMPRAVAGFTFGGQRGEVEKLIAKARVQAQTASPQGKLEHLQYGRFQIETFSDKGVVVAGCFARDWYFLANDVDLLKATLDRLSGKTLTALASVTAYRESQSLLPSHPDFRLFTQPGVISDKLLAQGNAPGQPPGTSRLRKLRALALASRFEGRRLRDTLFFYEPEALARPLLNGQTLGLTNTNTLFYAAMAPMLEDEARRQSESQNFPGGAPLRALFAALNSSPATWAQFKVAFGPEHAVLLDWAQDAPRPSLFFALEVRDPAEARRFVESVFRAWNRADAEGVSFWTLTMDDPTMAQFHPTVALTSHHLLAGLSPESLKLLASHATETPGGGATLAQSPAFEGAMATLPKPQTGIAYLDAKPLFEHIYGPLRPALMLWGGAFASFGGTVDFSKLPTVGCIARHLEPIGLSASQTGSGILMESTGPVSFLELGTALGATGFFVVLPALQPKTPGLPGKSAPQVLPSPPVTAPSASKTVSQE